MPTAYTAPVGTGEMTDFVEFALLCARDMDALVTMRNDPLSAEIPTIFEPSTFHQERLAEAREHLAELEALTSDQTEIRAFRDHQEKVRSNNQYCADRRRLRERYEAMLAKVRAWQPPSVDHVGMKDFMVEQLEKSIAFDCDESFRSDAPKRLDGPLWRAAEIAKAKNDIKYHTQEWEKEIVRTRDRNRWLTQLRDSLCLL
jgi:hypothetical protein